MTLGHERLAEILRAVEDPTKRRLYFAALLGKAAGVSPDDLIVVGGSAIEFYTVGEYTSGDIDLVSPMAERLKDVLKSWNFHRDGRILLHDDLEIVVDFGRSPYTWDQSKTQLLNTPHGPVRVAAMEDLLVKCLVSAKHWRRTGDFEHALLLARLHGEKMDWEYVEEKAREQRVGDFLRTLYETLESVA